MLCNKRNLIYIHIPKTAGTSIEKTLFPEFVYDESPNYDVVNGWDESYGWLNHLTFYELKNLFPNLDLSKFSIFTTVRNPWDRLVSEFFWKSSSSNMKISFTEFVHSIYNININHIQHYYKSTIAFTQHIKTQSSFLPEDKEINVTVIKFENLQKEFNDFCINRSIPVKTITKTRTSNHLNFREYYNHETRRLVEELYQEDIKRFDYSFS